MAQTSLFYFRKECVLPGLWLEGAPCITSCFLRQTYSLEQVVVVSSSKLAFFTNLIFLRFKKLFSPAISIWGLNSLRTGPLVTFYDELVSGRSSGLNGSSL